MGRPSRRGELLDAGVDVLHRRGYAAASVESITETVDVPKGAFFNHFGSKETFASEALRRYFERWQQQIEPIVNDANIGAVEKLRVMTAAATSGAKETSYSFGCLIGNLSAELASEHDSIRQTLAEIFRDWTTAFAAVIEAGQNAGELNTTLDPVQAARFVVNALQGALLRCKVDRVSTALVDLEEMVFGVILQADSKTSRTGRSSHRVPRSRLRKP
jgi:TetR/AcrR family transcriptional repressor of nem operon